MQPLLARGSGTRRVTLGGLAVPYRVTLHFHRPLPLGHTHPDVDFQRFAFVPEVGAALQVAFFHPDHDQGVMLAKQAAPTSQPEPQEVVALAGQPAVRRGNPRAGPVGVRMLAGERVTYAHQIGQ